MRIALASVVLVLAGCCMGHPVVEKALDDAISANKGHMADEALPEEAHLVAQDNYDFVWSIKFNLTGEALPEDVAARKAERDKLREDPQ